MKAEINAVILTGGLGTRMGFLAQDRPKSMLEIDGKPILTHIFDGLISEFGSAKVILATGYKGEEIKRTYGTQYRNISINYVHNPQHLEVRRRLLLADGLLDEPFLVIGSDVIIHPSQYTHMAQMFDIYSPNDIFGIISGAADLRPAPTHALIYTDQSRVVEIQTYPPFDTLNPSIYRDTSLWYFDQRTLHLLKKAPPSELNISSVLNEAIKKGAEYLVEKYFDHWYHFASPLDLQTHIQFKADNIKTYA